MSEGAVAPAPKGRQKAAGRAVGRDELSEGLMLLRASTIKVVRLQLAMERRDRRTAMEAVDDLVLLDGQICEYMRKMPLEKPRASALQQELDAQWSALAREKFALAAGMSGAAAKRRERGWIDLSPEAEARCSAAEPAAAALPPPAPPAWLGASVMIEEAVPVDPRRWLFRAGLLLVLLVLLAALMVAQTEAGQAYFDHLTRGEGR